MKKLLYIIPFLISLVGCANQPPKIEYQNVNIPIYIVPKAPTVDKPVLYLSSLTESQKNDIGELSKAYAISLKQEVQYACVLNIILSKYNELSLKGEQESNPGSISITSDDVNKECSN